MHKSLDKTLVKFKFNEKIISKTMAINACIINKAKKVLSHILKNQEVESLIKVKKAKGANKTNTLIII